MLIERIPPLETAPFLSLRDILPPVGAGNCESAYLTICSYARDPNVATHDSETSCAAQRQQSTRPYKEAMPLPPSSRMMR